MLSRKKKLYVALFIFMILALSYRHYSYIYGLSPIVQDIYQNKQDYIKGESHWSLDATPTLEKYLRKGMSKDDVIKFIEASGLNVSDDFYRSPQEIKEFDSSIIAYKYLRAGFAGMYGLFGASYTLSMSFKFNDEKLEIYKATLIENTI